MRKPPLPVIRAIQEGIDAARTRGKDSPAPYDQRHWLFDPWWKALVAKYDNRDWPDSRVFGHVLPTLKTLR